MVHRQSKVRPEAAHSHQKENPAIFRHIYNQVSNVWHQSQIGHRSEYSVERLLAFRDYYDRTSISRAVGVCVLTPIPSLVATLLIDCIPLRRPQEGWQANSTLWIRLYLEAFSVAMGFAVQIKEVLGSDILSNVGAFAVGLGTASSYVSLAVVTAAAWRFPVPFGYVLSAGPVLLLFWVFALVAIGPRVVVASDDLRRQIKSLAWITAAQGTVALVYPVFGVVFHRLSGLQQTVFVFTTPIIKVFTRQIIARAAEGLDEYVGPVVVFSEDVFHVFYVTVCMETAKLRVTALLMVASDMFHIIVALRAITRLAKIVKTRRGFALVSSSATARPMNYIRDLPGIVRNVFKDPDLSKSRGYRMRVFAPFALPLTDESVAFINEIARSRRATHDYSVSRLRAPRRSKVKPNSKSFHATNDISQNNEPREEDTTLGFVVVTLKQHQASPPVIATSKVGPRASVENVNTGRKGSAVRRLLTLMHSDTGVASKSLRSALVYDSAEEAVWDALRALFHSEYLLMAEYIEFALPTFYVVYLLLLSHLPVAIYYPHTEFFGSEKLAGAMISIVLFAMVEFAGFVGLVVLLQRKLGISPLYQLAFVLETQARTLQGHLFVWTVFILHLPLVHYGKRIQSIYTSFAHVSHK